MLQEEIQRVALFNFYDKTWFWNEIKRFSDDWFHYWFEYT